MAHASWGPGWPNCQQGKIKGLVRGDGLKVQLREEIIPLVALLIDETERRGYDVRRFNAKGEIVTGGFNCREIFIKGKGTGKPSNHSWGLAIDINSDVNPQGKTLKTDIPAGVVDLWQQFGFRWGGTFSTPDAMHFEYMGSTSDVSADTARAQQAFSGGGPVPTTTTTTTPAGNAFPGVILKQGASGQQVCRVQTRLRELGHHIDSKPSCPFGPQTEAAVRAFQKGKGLTDDGKVGKNTWNALFS
jgi:hypothetical protein